VVSIAGHEPRQALDDIGQPQKSTGVCGDHQRVVCVAFGLLGFALGQGDVGARQQRDHLVPSRHHRDGVIGPPAGRDYFTAGQ
jgi:hypothetical protein